MNRATNDDSLPGTLKALSDSIKKKVEHSLPCIVTAVTSRTRVTVRPLIQIVDNDGGLSDRDPYASVPVQTIGAGDVLISFPVKIGDLGWIEASDRDISIFLQEYKNSKPGTRRMHSFSDGKFVPDIMHNFSVSEEDSAAMVIQNRSGTMKIALDEEAKEIRIVNGDVSIVTTENNVTGIAPGGFDLNGAIIDSGGNVTTASGTSLDGHEHTVQNVQTGSSDITTTEPNP